MFVVYIVVYIVEYIVEYIFYMLKYEGIDIYLYVLPPVI